MDGLFSTGKTFFDTFIEDLLSMPIKLPLALYLVFPKYLFNMGPAFIFQGCGKPEDRRILDARCPDDREFGSNSFSDELCVLDGHV